MATTIGNPRPVVPNPNRQLSYTEVGDYIRLLYWIVWFPQAIRDYRANAPGRVAENEARVAGMSLWLMPWLMAYLGAFGLFLLESMSPAYESIWQNGLSWSAALGLSLLSLATGCSLARWHYGAIDGWFPWATVVPSLFVVTFTAIPHLQSSGLNPTFIAAAFGLSALAAGVLYSQLAAYYETGIAYPWRPLCAALYYAAIVTSIAAVIDFMIRRSSLAATLESAGYVLLFCCVGFGFGAYRIDDYLVGALFRLFGNSVAVGRLPKVTPIPVAGLQGALIREANPNWDATIQPCRLVWQFTLQRRSVVQALYALLVSSPPDRREQRWQLVASSSMPWLSADCFVRQGRKRFLYVLQNRREVSSSFDSNATLSIQIELDVNFLSVELLRRGRWLQVEQLYRQAMELPHSPIWEDSLTILQRRLTLITALHALLGSARPIGSGDVLILLDDYVRGPNEPIAGADIALVVWQLYEAHQYAWLARRCQRQEQSRQAARRALAELNSVELGIVDRGIQFQIDSYIRDARNSIAEINSGRLPPLEFPQRLNQNPFVYDEPIRYRDQLIGRQDDMRSFIAGWMDSHYQIIEITGPILAGKTSLLLAAFNDRSSNGLIRSQTLMAHFCLRHLTTDISPTLRVANAIYDELRWHIANPPTDLELRSEPYRVLERMIRALCEQERFRLVIGIDECDFLERIIQQDREFERFLRFIFHLNESLPYLGIVLIRTADNRPLLERFRSTTTPFTLAVTIGGLAESRVSEVDNRTLLDDDGQDRIAFFLNHAVPNFVFRFSEPAVSQIIIDSGGQPFLVQLIAWNVVRLFELNYRHLGGNYSIDRAQAALNPFFSEVDVVAARNLSTFVLGCQYYISRLAETFGADWRYVSIILTQVPFRNRLATRREIQSAFDDANVNIDPDRLSGLLRRMVQLEVLYDIGRRRYLLRIGLLPRMLRTP